MDASDFFILNDPDNYKMGESLVLISNDIYSNIISQINYNYLLIIFTMGCVGGLFFCNKHDNKQTKEYIIVSN